MNFDGEFFGTPEIRAAVFKASQLWNVVNDDPRFQCHGRAVGVNWGEKDVDLSLHLSLARLQGVASCDGIPVSETDDYIRALEREGMKTDRYEEWRTKPGALENAEQILAENRFRDDLGVEVISSETPQSSLIAVAELTESCGVTLPMGTFVRGISRPSVYMYVQDIEGRPVGHASSTAAFHKNSSSGGIAHWGMLATHQDRRGEKIALILGAKSMLEMNRQHGYENFVTGIRQGNAPSESLCAKLQLYQTDKTDVIAIDPESFAGDQMNK